MDASIDKLREAMGLPSVKNSSSKEAWSAISDEWETFHQETQRQVIEGLNRRKEEAFSERLEQLGLEMYLKEEEGRRFKRFMKEIQGDTTTIYFNDGSVNGLRIITFVSSSEPFKVEDECYLTTEIKYF